MLFFHFQRLVKFMVGYFFIPIGGVCSSSIKVMPFSFFYITQESKNWNKSRNWANVGC
jgi:hypothetical protein